MIDLQTQSIRAKILQVIGERCQDLLVLLPSDGEVEPDVYWARQQLLPTEVPAAVVTPKPDEPGDQGHGFDRLTMPVSISLACLIGNHNPLDLSEMLLAEMREKIPLSDQTLGGLARDVRYMGGGVDDYPEQDEQALVVTTIFEIDYETELNNPNTGV
jgi:hypothetical protein